MRKLLAAAALTLLFPLAASAEVSLGASLGVAVPMGDAVKDGALSDEVKAGIPLEVTLNFTAAPNLEIGVYGGYEFGILSDDLKDACDLAGEDCSLRGYRLGLAGEYLFAHEGEGAVPFFGASFGWAWETLKEELGGDSLKQTWSGWELGFKAGADKKVSEKLKIGGFVGVALGEYTNLKVTADIGGFTSSDSASVPSSERAIHAWLSLGVRGAFGL